MMKNVYETDAVCFKKEHSENKNNLKNKNIKSEI